MFIVIFGIICSVFIATKIKKRVDEINKEADR